jgi:hypothetical protein
VSRPSNETNQKDLYSKKKKQFAINVLIICLLNGKIIYISKHRKGAHDQSHWNELDFRSRFVGKDYGIARDGVTNVFDIHGAGNEHKRCGVTQGFILF